MKGVPKGAMVDRARRTCVVCDEPLRVMWTDTSHVAQCLTCNTPYEIKGHDVPRYMIADFWLQRCRDYWRKFHHKIPHGFNCTSDREQCSDMEANSWNEWAKENAPKGPTNVKEVTDART